MVEPFIGQISVVAFNFAPRGWALCNGQILSIQQNTALFSLLGTTYGGNGTTNFALPDLRGRVPVHAGQGNSLSQYTLGELAGEETVTLLQSQMPQHTHHLTATAVTGTTNDPTGALLAKPSGSSRFVTLYTDAAANATAAALPTVGSSHPHNNLQPYLTLNFVIALVGVFPARN